MKKTIILLALVSITQTIVAQTEKRFYVNTNFGYNIGTGNTNTYQSSLLGIVSGSETSATTSNYKVEKINLGQGLSFGLNFGYMFNKSFGLECGANYLLGAKIKGSTTSYNGNYSNSEIEAKMFQFKPALVFRGGFEKINPYAKVGMVIGSGKIISTQNFKDGPNLETGTLELYDATPIGFHASIGTLFALNSKFSVFGELNLVSLEYSANKGKVTQSIRNGVDVLPSLTVREKELEFIDTQSSPGISDPNQPNKTFKIPLSLNSFGFNIGLQYQL